MPTFHFYFCHETDPIFTIKAENKFLAWGMVIERAKDYNCPSIYHMKKIGFRIKKEIKMFKYTDEELANLSPEWRNALIDIDHKGFSYAEHALANNINIGTVKSRVHRARAKVREMREINVA